MRGSWPGCGRKEKEDQCDVTSNILILVVGEKNINVKGDSNHKRTAHIHGKTSLHHQRERTQFVFLKSIMSVWSQTMRCNVIISS